MHLLGDECDAVTMKNFMKAAVERAIVVHPDGTVDEFFEGFFRAFEGNSSLANNLDDPMHSIASLSGGAKARLKHFLSDPDAGNLWKIDDPIWGPTGEPDIPHNYWRRGIVAELNLCYRTCNPLGFEHLPTQPGFDYRFGNQWSCIGAWQWRTNYWTWRNHCLTEGYERFWGGIPPEVTRNMKPSASGPPVSAPSATSRCMARPN